MDALNLIHATCTKIGIGTEKYRRYINIYHYYYYYYYYYYKNITFLCYCLRSFADVLAVTFPK